MHVNAYLKSRVATTWYDQWPFTEGHLIIFAIITLINSRSDNFELKLGAFITLLINYKKFGSRSRPTCKCPHLQGCMSW